MANVESVRLSRKVPRRGGKSSKRPEQSARSPEAALEAIQETGWTPELEAELLGTPVLLQIEPQFMNILVKEAGQRRDENLWRLVAEICERRNEDQKALTYATEALQIQPDDVASMRLSARLCEKRHADAEAADWHQRILAIDPSQTVSNRSLAYLHYHRGEYETALQYLTRLVELEPKAHINKLYWLLATVKSAGMHGLAQPLTDVRRWRSFTPEEKRLAHELFVLVGTQCLQLKQRARAKQYLTRAMQLVPTSEVEALLGEMPESVLATSSTTKTTIAAPTVRISVPLERQPLESLSAVLLNDTRDRWSRVHELVTSGIGMITALVVVALFTMWSVSHTPERQAFHNLQEDEMRSAEDVAEPSPSKQTVTIPTQKPLTSQEQGASTPTPSPPPSTSSAKTVSARPETKKVDPSLALAKKPLNAPAPSVMPMSEQKIAPKPVQSSPPNTVTNMALLERPPAPKPSMPDPQLTAKKEVPQATLPSQADEKSTNASTGDKEVLAQVTSAVPNVPKSASSSLPQPVPLAEPPMVAVAPPSSATVKKGKIATVKLAPPITSAPPVSVSTTPVVKEKLTEETARVRKASPSVVANSDSSVEAAVEKIENLNTTLEPLPTSAPPASVSATPVVEEKTIAKTAIAVGVQETPPPTITSAKLARIIEEPLPSSEESGQKAVAAIALEEQPSVPSVDTQTPPAAGDLPGREEQTTIGGDSTSTRTVSNASNAIARLSSQLPHTGRFPTRERLVSVPLERLLPTMKALMKQQTGARSVASPIRGVLRARVSGKRTSDGRAPTMYGQYLVEVTPGPTEGTSRVRAQALMFDWRTGQPIEDAGSLADRLLEKVGE